MLVYRGEKKGLEHGGLDLTNESRGADIVDMSVNPIVVVASTGPMTLPVFGGNQGEKNNEGGYENGDVVEDSHINDLSRIRCR
jgi:hypothetical protein